MASSAKGRSFGIVSFRMFAWDLSLGNFVWDHPLGDICLHLSEFLAFLLRRCRFATFVWEFRLGTFVYDCSLGQFCPETVDCAEHCWAIPAFDARSVVRSGMRTATQGPQPRTKRARDRVACVA